jgi:hypothetical protein
MFTGYSPVSKAFRIYLGGGVWRESRDVEFVEHIRGASRVGIHILPGQPQQFSYHEGLQLQQQASESPAGPNQLRTQNGAISIPCSSNRHDSTLPEAPDEAATEPGCQGKCLPEEGASDLATGRCLPEELIRWTWTSPACWRHFIEWQEGIPTVEDINGVWSEHSRHSEIRGLTTKASRRMD